MASDDLAAFRVTLADDAHKQSVFVVTAPDLAAAAQFVGRKLADTGQVMSLEFLGPLLVAGAASEGRSRPAASAEAPVQAQPRAQGHRQLELIALLQERGDPVHYTDVAKSLAITEANAQVLISRVERQRLIRRVGSRTGLVALPLPDPKARENPALLPTSTRGPTHADRLLELLRDRGGPAHMDQIAAQLGTTRGTVYGVVRAGISAGQLRRLQKRPGMVALAGVDAEAELVPEPPPAPSKRKPTRARQADGDVGLSPAHRPDATPQGADPAALQGIQRRVFEVLLALGAPATAKEVASQLGVRPREAGNAAALLVDGLLVQRVDGGEKPRYRALR